MEEGPIAELSEQIDSIKQLIPDQTYINMMKSLKTLHNKAMNAEETDFFIELRHRILREEYQWSITESNRALVRTRYCYTKGLPLSMHPCNIILTPKYNSPNSFYNDIPGNIYETCPNIKLCTRVYTTEGREDTELHVRLTKINVDEMGEIDKLIFETDQSVTSMSLVTDINELIGEYLNKLICVLNL